MYNFYKRKEGFMNMKIMKMLIVSTITLFIFAGCNKKKKEELTPLNAPAKYGETMGRAMKKAEGMQDVLNLKNEINTFLIQEGRYPQSLQELVDKGYIKEIPKSPENMQFVYDPKTGTIDVR